MGTVFEIFAKMCFIEYLMSPKNISFFLTPSCKRNNFEASGLVKGNFFQIFQLRCTVLKIFPKNVFQRIFKPNFVIF